MSEINCTECRFYDKGDCTSKSKLVLRNRLYFSDKKLKEIEEYCIGTLETFNNSSGINAYSAGRCIEAEAILQIITGVIK